MAAAMRMAAARCAAEGAPQESVDADGARLLALSNESSGGEPVAEVGFVATLRGALRGHALLRRRRGREAA